MKKLLKVGALLLAPLVGACSDDPIEPDPADLVVAIRLTIGTQTITINQAGTITGGPVTTTTAATSITGAFLDVAGQPVAVPTAEFELRVIPDNSGRLTFTRNSAFAGNLTRVATGAASLSVSLYHTGEGHDDFGPFTVPVTVQ
jgi:hypothetical protein